jgi:type IV pilus assembly protein PilW
MNLRLNLHTMQLRRSQRGMGLVELMVSIAIALVLLIALAYFYIGSRQVSRTHDDLSRMEESGRNAMEIIGKAARQAGFRLDISKPLYVNPVNNISVIMGTDGGGAAFGATGAATAPSDILVVRHDPTWVTDATNPIKGTELDCLGNSVVSNNNANASSGAVPVNTNVLEYTFSVDAANRGLICNNVAGTVGATVVVDNIERMQITYGLRNAAGAITAYVAAPTAAQWLNVAAVRVSLLVRGPSRGIATNNSQTYTFNGESVTATDGFLRQVYTSTFTLRNQAL